MNLNILKFNKAKSTEFNGTHVSEIIDSFIANQKFQEFYKN